MSQSIYYVYAYLRARDDSPYYIGKGCKRRAYEKRNRTVSVPKDKTKIVFLHQNLFHDEALALEQFYISLFGRKYNQTGILLNITEGGVGVSGLRSPFKGRTHTPEAKAKVSLANKGRKSNRKSEDFTLEWRKKLALAHKGQVRIQSDMEKLKRRQWAKNMDMGLARGTLWINNGIKSIRVKPEQLSNYPGFTRGRITRRNVNS